MRSENEALWGEVLSLRQKHNQQQKIVNKLIQFLSALLQPRGMKRSFGRGSHSAQLAIEDIRATAAAGQSDGPTGAKQQKMSDQSGPIIQELPANLNPSQLSSVLNNLNSPPTMVEPEPLVEFIIDPSTSGR